MGVRDTLHNIRRWGERHGLVIECSDPNLLTTEGYGEFRCFRTHNAGAFIVEVFTYEKKDGSYGWKTDGKGPLDVRKAIIRYLEH